MIAARRRPALLVPLVAAVLALAGCSGGSGDDDGAAAPSTGASSGASSAAATADLTQVSVTPPAAGATGKDAVPTVTVPAGFSTGTTTSRVLAEGNGDAAAEGEVLSVEFVGVNGRDGKAFGSSTWTGQPTQFVLGPGVIPGFTTALEGVKAGTQLLVAVAPADGYGPQGGLQQAGIGATDTLVYLIDVKGVAPGWATGTPVDPSTFPAGLPQVTVDQQTHVPAITVDTQAAPPTSLVKQVLVTGGGEPVQKGQNLTMQYTGVTWSTGKEFDSSWSRGTPFDFTLGDGKVIAGWDQGLEGVPVGSQVMLVIPPDLGYGDQSPSEDIPAGSTLVFVVDVLAAQ
ncbi:FKBP-type peptidyl-prolyl cis-trans isomerase [Streptomyces sp. NP160]|uniref:FKBP-type peptidyl-prolyl cis-trans isomerase n=1 Tax=Streptomyces sp. NP160 TaxID=2586637 RepID=UPI00111A4CE1|nr:FKBP-type peptidyl-prolyl cis-trans isomerase [Streptomyces sp. NP160]TNM70190.1 FKBP-type peptidyl-prolyl cis-trans isomerase [Streptomyces sp. NP160]